MVEIGPILAQVSATTISLARFVSLEANRARSPFQTCVIFTRKYKFWQTNGCSRAILYALIWSATCACCAASLVSPSKVNIKKDQGTLIDAYPLSTFIAPNRGYVVSIYRVSKYKWNKKKKKKEKEKLCNLFYDCYNQIYFDSNRYISELN